jgi:hypothetical protein
MTTARVLTKNEVSINNIRYPTTGLVGQHLIPSAAELPLIWEPTFKGGIGKHKVRFNEQSEKAWWSTCQLGYDHQIVPRQLETTTAVSGVTGTFSIGAIGELADEIYVAFGTAVRKYNNTTDSWGSTLHTLPAVATDAITFRMNNVVYLAFAHTGGYTYFNGTTWVDDTADVLYFTFWDNRLWGIDNTGQLWYSYNIGAEDNGAQLPLPNGSINDLYLARNGAGDVVIHAATTRGPYAYDAEFTKWWFTELTLPEHPDNGKGTTGWRGFTFIPSGLQSYQHVQGANSAVVTVMGPDREDGLPSDYRGVIKQLVGTHNDLLAVLDSTRRAATFSTYVTNHVSRHRGVVMSPDVGFSSILGWDEIGWQVKFLSARTARALSYAHVSNAYSEYRIWFALGEEILFLPLQREIRNPNEDSTATYATPTELITPWLEADRDKTATGVYVRVGGRELTSTQTIVVDYGTNDSETWTTLGTITSDGITEYLLPNSTTPSGTGFLTFRLRFTLTRGTTTTTKAILSPPTFAFRYKAPAKYRFTVELDLTHGYGDQTPKQMRDSLRTAIESSSFIPLGYRNDSDTDFGSGDRRFYVDIIGGTNLEETGEDERGTSTIMMVEA